MRSFGDGQSCSGSDLSPLHFTGKPRDLETRLDDFGARPYSSSLGRWMTPDWSAAPEAVPYADLSDPQTLNLYAYAENNPVTRTDADGHIPIDDTWMQTGHDMQEVGFAFHLWPAQPEGEAKGGCTSGGCTVNVVAPRPRDIALQFVRSWAWQAWRGISQSFQHWWSTRGCQPGQLCIGTVLPEGELELGAAEAISESADEVQAILSRAALATGNESIYVADRATAERAAKEWAGEDAEPIYADRGAGSQVGWKSADGTKIVRFTSADRSGYINLVNRITGSNLHVRW